MLPSIWQSNNLRSNLHNTLSVVFGQKPGPKEFFGFTALIPNIVSVSWKNWEGIISIFETVKSHKGPIISESGIKNENDVKYIYDKTGIKNFLIGESLLSSNNPAALIKKIIQINQ